MYNMCTKKIFGTCTSTTYYIFNVIISNVVLIPSYFIYMDLSYYDHVDIHLPTLFLDANCGFLQNGIK